MIAKRFQVALSFPGERRPYVEEVARYLAETLGQETVFYDNWYKHELARPNLDTYLQGIYHNDSQLLVPFLCAEYEHKQWCGLEWRAIRDLIKNRQDQDIMPLRFDATHIPGLFEIDGYIDLQSHTPVQAAELIVKRLRLITGKAAQAESQTRIYSNRLPATLGSFFGRKRELKLLDAALADDNTAIVQFIAPGGTGKTKLLQHWLDRQTDMPVLIAWSFYSQGSSDDKQVSATPFFEHAFDKLKAEQRTFRSEEDKGEYLAELLTKQTSLLLLDGLEPLQHGGFGMKGELKDRAVRALLKTLAGGRRRGLCVITTRLAVVDIQCRSGVVGYDLHNLDLADGVALLQSLNVKGRPAHIEQAVEDYGRHALALSLLGNALATFHGGDVQKRDLLSDLIDEQGEPSSRHAFKVMQGYCDWLSGTTELQVLHVLGLFDHPVGGEVIKHLWDAQIPGLTATDEADDAFPLGKRGTEGDLSKQISPGPSLPKRGTESVTFKSWQSAVKALRDDHHLLLKQPDGDQLDCHPLLREYFGRRLQNRPEVWQQAHCCLYEYYKALPDKQLPDTLSEMPPLFAAVGHGCAAGLHHQALHEVYWPRIKRKEEHYLTKKLGAFIDDQAVLAHFFSRPWQQPAEGLSENDQAVVLGWAGFRLRALGRLAEAVQPMQAGLAISVKRETWHDAASNANNLSELNLALGDVPEALHYGAQAVEHGDRSGDLFYRMGFRTTHADALQQSGDLAAALALFEQAELIQQQRQPGYPRLYSLPGFRYCDYLLELGGAEQVFARAEQTLSWAQQVNVSLLDIALNQLSLAKAHSLLAYPATAEPPQTIAASTALDAPAASPNAGAAADAKLKPTPATDHAELARSYTDQAVAGLRAAGQNQYLPLALLARAALFRLQQDFSPARKDLAEVLDIAEPANMRLHLCDCHLEAVRLALAERDANAAAEHCAKAGQLIEATGYLRRLAEWQALRQALDDGIAPDIAHASSVIGQ